MGSPERERGSPVLSIISQMLHGAFCFNRSAKIRRCALRTHLGSAPRGRNPSAENRFRRFCPANEVRSKSAVRRDALAATGPLDLEGEDARGWDPAGRCRRLCLSSLTICSSTTVVKTGASGWATSRVSGISHPLRSSQLDRAVETRLALPCTKMHRFAPSPAIVSTARVS